MSKSSKEKMKGLAGVLAVVGLFGILVLSREPDDDNDATKIVKELTSDLSDFEKMEAEMSKKPQNKEHLSDKMKAFRERNESSGASASDITTINAKNDSSEQTGNATVKKECGKVEKALNRPWCKDDTTPSSNLPSISNNGSNSAKESNGGNRDSNQQDSGTQESRKKQLSGAEKLLAWGKLSEDTPNVLKGRQTQYTDKVIKAGCEILVVLQNEVVAIPGSKHIMKLNARGPLDGCILPKSDGLQFIATGTLMANDAYILANVTTCTDRDPKSKSVDCSKSLGRVLSITGTQALEGELYDDTGWGIFWDAVLALGFTPAISKLTETAANAKTIFQSSSAASIADTLTKALNRVSEKISGQFDNKEVRITPKLGKPITMIVVFERDVILN